MMRSLIKPSGRSPAFTLMELLIAVLIIVILCGLLFPALQNALRNTKKAQANAMIQQLKIAITAYNVEYGTWPTNPTGTDAVLDNGQLYHALLGDTAGIAYGNTRQIQFIEFASRDLDNPTAPTTFTDPWYHSIANAAQTYHVQVDSDYDNTITTTGLPGGDVTINAEIAVWDPGAPTGNTVNTTSSATALKSW